MRPSEEIDRILDVVEGGILLCMALAIIGVAAIAVYAWVVL